VEAEQSYHQRELHQQNSICGTRSSRSRLRGLGWPGALRCVNGIRAWSRLGRRGHLSKPKVSEMSLGQGAQSLWELPWPNLESGASWPLGSCHLLVGLLHGSLAQYLMESCKSFED
jgi:hypothetical protein